MEDSAFIKLKEQEIETMERSIQDLYLALGCKIYIGQYDEVERISEDIIRRCDRRHALCIERDSI